MLTVEKQMRRSIFLLFILLLLDQVAKNLINSFIPVDTILSFGSSVRLVVGNSHHYAVPEFPALMVALCVVGFASFLLLGWGFAVPSQPSHLSRIFIFSGLCFLFEGITQGLDHALHGYVINYFGFYIADPFYFGEIAHVGDYVFRFGAGWAIVGLLAGAKHELTAVAHRLVTQTTHQ
jgi:hypothetical protein